jgi:hypothetical protein
MFFEELFQANLFPGKSDIGRLICSELMEEQDE